MPIPEAQQRQFERGHASDKVRAMTGDIYAQIDAMTAEQQALLTREALGNAHGLLDQIVADPQHTPAYATMAAGLIAIAGYVTESAREARGETSTGDSKVTAVLELFEELVRVSALDQMPAEDREIALAITAAATERAEKGEDFEAAIRDEYAKRRAAGFRPSDEPAQASTSDDLPGMYL
jgi:hypothetical protein